MNFHTKISKNFAFELNLFNCFGWKYGVNWFDLSIETSHGKIDHAPSFRFQFIVFNVSLIEFSVYNVNHYD